MNLQKLKYVVEVARQGSVTAAAKSLGLTQSVVTRALADIEKDLGYALFYRHSRGMVETEEGRDFIDRASRIFTDIDALIEDSSLSTQEQAEILRIGVCPPSLEGLLNRAILRLIKNSPLIRLHSHAVSLHEGIERLRRGDIDILVAPNQRFEKDPDFRVEPLTELNVSFCVNKEHPLLKKSGLKVADLVEYPIILPRGGEMYVNSLLRVIRESGKTPEKVFHILDNVQIIQNILLETHCIGIFSQGYASSQAMKRQFSKLQTDFDETVQLVCINRAKWLPKESVRSFISSILAFPPQ
ncbi:LysR family transcriptional regulator [Emcibacter sp.]|uniref:LysR family transcriptional regulator n=1 Tax=Emcibacter sp. TaxID=1979954 RepID=UPI003A8F8AD1